MRRRAELIDEQYKLWERRKLAEAGERPVLACSSHIWCVTPKDVPDEAEPAPTR